MASIQTDELSLESASCFQKMVHSVGVKRFASVMGLSTRQINRMLSGAQPNPVERIVRALQSCEPEIGDDALGFICQEAGGWFIKDEGDLDRAAVNAVRECAQAIDAIADGEVTQVDEGEIREAVCALTALLRSVQEQRRASGGAPVRIQTTPAATAARVAVGAQRPATPA